MILLLSRADYVKGFFAGTFGFFFFFFGNETKMGCDERGVVGMVVIFLLEFGVWSLVFFLLLLLV